MESIYLLCYPYFEISSVDTRSSFGFNPKIKCSLRKSDTGFQNSLLLVVMLMERLILQKFIQLTLLRN